VKPNNLIYYQQKDIIKENKKWVSMATRRQRSAPSAHAEPRQLRPDADPLLPLPCPTPIADAGRAASPPSPPSPSPPAALPPPLGAAPSVLGRCCQLPLMPEARRSAMPPAAGAPAGCCAHSPPAAAAPPTAPPAAVDGRRAAGGRTAAAAAAAASSRAAPAASSRAAATAAAGAPGGAALAGVGFRVESGVVCTVVAPLEFVSHASSGWVGGRGRGRGRG
jgi:hypothetical protein